MFKTVISIGFELWLQIDLFKLITGLEKCTLLLVIRILSGNPLGPLFNLCTESDQGFPQFEITLKHNMVMILVSKVSSLHNLSNHI